MRKLFSAGIVFLFAYGSTPSIAFTQRVIPSVRYVSIPQVSALGSFGMILQQCAFNPSLSLAPTGSGLKISAGSLRIPGEPSLAIDHEKLAVLILRSPLIGASATLPSQSDAANRSQEVTGSGFMLSKDQVSLRRHGLVLPKILTEMQRVLEDIPLADLQKMSIEQLNVVARRILEHTRAGEVALPGGRLDVRGSRIAAANGFKPSDLKYATPVLNKLYGIKDLSQGSDVGIEAAAAILVEGNLKPAEARNLGSRSRERINSFWHFLRVTTTQLTAKARGLFWGGLVPLSQPILQTLTDPYNHNPQNFIYLVHGFQETHHLPSHFKADFEKRIDGILESGHFFRASLIGWVAGQTTNNRPVRNISTWGNYGFILTPRNPKAIYVAWNSDLGSPNGAEALKRFANIHRGKIQSPLELLSDLSNEEYSFHNELVLEGSPETIISGVFYKIGDSQAEEKAKQLAEIAGLYMQKVLPLVKLPSKASSSLDPGTTLWRKEMRWNQLREEMLKSLDKFYSRNLMSRIIWPDPDF